MRLRLVEIILLQVIFYSLIYLWNSYIGFLLCLIIACIAFAILLLSLIFDALEKSKIPRSYYWFILSASLVPALVAIFFSYFLVGSFDWLNE